MDRANELINKYKLPIGLSILGIVLIIGGIVSSNLFTPKKTYPKASLIEDKTNYSDFKVDISGAVKSPGVYSISSNSRVEDAIKIAGGFVESTNKEFISKSLNLSAKLYDGQKLYIPFDGEQTGGIVAGVSGSVNKVGLNSATQAELEALSGVGPVTAQKIISHRPYSDTSQLLSRKAVTKATFEKIKEEIDLH